MSQPSNAAGVALLAAGLAAIAFDPELSLALLDFHENARSDLGDLAEITASISRHGVLQPIGVIREGNRFILWTGHRRAAASKLLGKETIPANIYPPMDDIAFETGQITENLIRAEMGDVDIYRSCKKLMSLNDGWQRKDLAQHLGKSASAVTHYLSPDDLIPEAREAFLAGKFSLSKAYSIAKSKDQAAQLKLALEKRTRKEMDQSRMAQDGKAASYTIPIDGVEVSIKGKGLTLASLPKLLNKLVREAKEQIELNQTLESFQLWMTNRAAAVEKRPDAAPKKRPDAGKKAAQESDEQAED